MSDELPKALVLRLDSARAVLLNQLVSIGCAILNGDAELAVEVAQHARRFGEANPGARSPLLRSVEQLVLQIPPEFMDAQGIAHYSHNEIQYHIARHKPEREE